MKTNSEERERYDKAAGNAVSIVIPIFNEEKSLKELFSRLSRTLDSSAYSYEIVAVDDGSRDNSFAVLQEIAAKDLHVRVLRFKRNFGQTAALSAAIEHSRGDIIVSIDSDLENDPSDIISLLEKMKEGFTVVSGWRKSRWKGSFLTRKLPSVLANGLISFVTGVKLHDYGCTLKAYKADVIKGVKLYGEMHRFIPAYAAWYGGRVAELPVSHAPRLHGKSNYGFGRVFRVLLDLVVVVFMHRYMNRPMHFFGGWGFLSFGLGMLTIAIALYLKFIGFASLIQTPLPVLAVLFVVVGVQLILFGVVSEMLMRTYYESQDRRPYIVKEVINS